MAGTVLSCQRYSADGYKARRLLSESRLPYPTRREALRGLDADPLRPGASDDPSLGVPFLTGSDVMMARLESRTLFRNREQKHFMRFSCANGLCLSPGLVPLDNVAFCTSDLEGVLGQMTSFALTSEPVSSPRSTLTSCCRHSLGSLF